MNVPFVDLSALHKPLQPALSRAFDVLTAQGTVMGGEAVPDFERAFAQYVGVRHCVACANGTDALEIVLRALEIGAGHEVIVPANGWLSAAESVRLVGATPVYVDSHPLTYNINDQLVEEKVTARTRAIIPIHLYGRPANLAALSTIAERHQLRLIEDAAQAHGAIVENRKVGGWGHAATFSFYPTKNLGALGDAGAITTNDDTLADAVRAVAQHGQHVRNYPVCLGRNSRMDNLQAAVLSLKLPHLDRWNQRRKAIANRYYEQLQPVLGSDALPTSSDESVHHLFVIQLDRRDEIREQLQRAGITTAIHYPQTVIDMMERETGWSATLAPVAHRQAQRVLSLPINPSLTDTQVDYVVSQIERYGR